MDRMLVSHAGRVLWRGAWALLGGILLCGIGCAGTYAGNVYQNSWKRVHYRMGTPNGWQPVQGDGVDVHLRHPEYPSVSMISQSQCDESAASKTLPQLAAPLFAALSGDAVVLDQETPMDQRPALHLAKTGVLAGVPVYLAVIVTVKDGCAYTFSLFQSLDAAKNTALAQELHKQQPRRDFLQWVQGFSVISEGTK